MKLERAKGTRDFLPKEKIVRQEVVDTLKKVFERYGFSPLETPIIERYDICAAKFGAGEESDIMKEIFTLQDQGGRKLGLRYELTFPLARVIGMNPQLKMPFKRYQIGRVFRDGPIKLGRYREFWQCDVDIVGAASVMADAEVISIAAAGFNELGLDVVIEVNNRKLLNEIMAKTGIAEPKRENAIIIVDKLKKIGEQEVLKELVKEGISNEQASELMQVLSVQGENFEKLKQLKEFLGETEGVKETEELFKYLASFEVDFVFVPMLARGLAYYTGPVYEVFLKNSEITSSVAGGGRWDDMIAKYLGRKEKIPATGISFGLEPITEELKKKEQRETVTKVFVIPIGTVDDCIKIVQELRSKGVNTEMDLLKRGISKNLNYANSLKIPYAVFVGEEELKAGKLKLRDMNSGKENMVSVKDLVKKVC